MSTTTPSSQELELELLRWRGSADQARRYAHGQLPQDELLSLAREELFRPLGYLERRRKRTHSDLHPPIVGEQPCRAHPSEIRWVVVEIVDLAPQEHITMGRIHESIAEISEMGGRRYIRPDETLINVSVREHRGTCTRCCLIITDRGALVSICWAGHHLSREYAL